jgi:4-hydroxy-3-methylbut-2-en-1-yl diphosphate synthase IspG/GcpE
VAVPSQDDADALAQIAKKSQIPVIADIHFQPKYIFAAIDAGCAAVRVNPGNIKQFDDKVKEVAKAAGDAGIPIRIGVNAGSLDPRLLAKYGSPNNSEINTFVKSTVKEFLASFETARGAEEKVIHEYKYVRVNDTTIYHFAFVYEPSEYEKS